MSVLSFECVSKRFGQKIVLDGFSLQLERGEIYGLLGPNGSGKSTAINILCGLLDADSGTVQISGGEGRDVGAVVGICPQEIALYRDLDARENLEFFAKVHGMTRDKRRRRVSELSRLFGLDAVMGSPVSRLSGGWQRRVNIAVALVHSPELLVLDEPTSAVDLEARHELWSIIERLRREGATLLLTTHHLDEAERLCSRIGVLKDHRIVAEGSIAQLLAVVPARSIALIEAASAEGATARVRQLGWGIRQYAGKLACLLPEVMSLTDVVRAMDGVELSSINIQPLSLEHAYLEITSWTQVDRKASRD